MKQICLLFFLFLLSFTMLAQTDPDASARIGKEIQDIYKKTNWNDPVAAEKANAEIKKLTSQLPAGSNNMPFQIPPKPAKPGAKPANVGYQSKTAPTKENVVAINYRFFNQRVVEQKI